MAAWQFYFSVIEKIKMKHEGQIVHENEVDKYLEWAKIPEKEIGIISAVLKSEKSWSKDIYQFGSLDASCVEILKNEREDSFEISCRISLHEFNVSVFKAILSFVNSIDGIIMVDNVLYNATKDNLIELMSKSKACNLCKCSELLMALKVE